MTQPRKQKVREELKKQRRRRVITTTIIFVVLATIGVVTVIFLQQQAQSNPQLVGQTIPNSLYANMAGVTNATLNSVGTGGTSPLTSETGSLLTGPNGKPEFLYIGADFCPYCAAERWSIITALSKFGTFTGLEYMLSGDAPEAFPDTSTFTFVHATYSSQYIDFVSVETADRLGKPLQTVTSDEQSLWTQYDPPGKGIPFIDLGNQYVYYVSSQFSPGIINGLDWNQIATQLDTPSSTVARNVDGAANRLITALCTIDHGLPSSVCSQSYAKLAQAPISSPQMPPAQFNSMIAADQIETRALGKNR